MRFWARDKPVRPIRVATDFVRDFDVETPSGIFNMQHIEQLEYRALRTSLAFVEHEIARGDFYLVAPADLNGDGHPDLVVVERDRNGHDHVRLFESEGGGNFSSESRRIGEAPDGLGVVFGPRLRFADIDNDGDEDIVLLGQGQLPAWYENELGDASSWVQRDVGHTPRLDSLATPRLVDVDGDEDLDIVATGSRHLYVYKNDGGEFAVDVQQALFAASANQIIVADFDGDGDHDLIRHLGSDPDDESGTIRRFMYHEAIGEEYSLGMEFSVFEPAQDIFGVTLYATDVNQDDALDLLVAGIGGVKAYTNQAAQFVESPVGWGRTGWFAVHAQVADMDADGDADVVVAVDGTVDGGSVDWFENLDGSGTLSPYTQISANPRFEVRYSFVGVADLDGDGALDVAASAHSSAEPGGETGKLVWNEQRRVGDTDDNGQVNFADFLVLSANFGQIEDAVWEDGDFNADGGIDFEDFLLLSPQFGS